MKTYIALILAVLIGVSAFGGYLYFNGLVATSIATIGEVKGSVETLIRRDSLSRSAALFVAETATERAALDAFVISQPDIVTVIDEIESLPTRSLVAAIASVEEVAVPDWKNHGLIIMKISARGPFKDVVAYGDKLEHLPYGVRILNATFEATDDSWFGFYTVAFVKEITP